MTPRDILLEFRNHDLPLGKMLSLSKGEYRRDHKDHVIYFNANVFVLSEGKIWGGDLDLTLEGSKLQKIADKIGMKIFVTKEIDGYNDSGKDLSESQIIEKAVWTTK